MSLCGQKGNQTEGTACAKVLRWNRLGGFVPKQGSGWGWVEGSEQDRGGLVGVAVASRMCQSVALSPPVVLQVVVELSNIHSTADIKESQKQRAEGTQDSGGQAPRQRPGREEAWDEQGVAPISLGRN